MKFLKKLFYWLLFIIALVLIISLFLPTQFQVERSAMISQPKTRVFEYLKLLKNQEIYSVWWKADPGMKKSYTGTDGQPGFISSWNSKNKDVGSGQQKIIAIQDGQRIDTELKFFEPFEATNQAFLSTAEVDQNNTRVSWGISGNMPYPTNFMSIFINMEETLGNDLEKGLKNLKRILEK